MTKLSSNQFLRYAVGLLCSLGVGVETAQTQTPSLAPRPARLEFSAISSEPVLSYTVIHEMLAENDPTPLVRVYGDGRVLVHRPAFMKDPGDFEMYLTPNELRGLLDSMAARQVMSATTESVRRDRDAARLSRRQRGELHAVLDASYSVIDIRVDTFQETATSKTVSDFKQTLIVDNLQAEAQSVPEVGVLQNLLAAETEIRQLLARQELERRR